MAIDELIPSSGTDIIINGIVFSGALPPGYEVDQETIKVRNIIPYTSGPDDKIFIKGLLIVQNPISDTETEHTLRFAGASSTTDNYNVISNVEIGGKETLVVNSGAASSSTILSATEYIKFGVQATTVAKEWDGTVGSTIMQIDKDSVIISNGKTLTTNTILPTLGGVTNVNSTLFSLDGGTDPMMTAVKISVDNIVPNLTSTIDIDGTTFSSGDVAGITNIEMTNASMNSISSLGGGNITVNNTLDVGANISIGGGIIETDRIDSSIGNFDTVGGLTGATIDINGSIFGVGTITVSTSLTSPIITTTQINPEVLEVFVVSTQFKDLLGIPGSEHNYDKGKMWIYDIDTNIITGETFTTDSLAVIDITANGGGSINVHSDIDMSSTQLTSENIVCDKVTATSLKTPCEAATISEITPWPPSGSIMVDGVVSGTNRILVKDQTVETQNGIWQSGLGVWTRPSDAEDA
jgi:hypothetical protein